MPLCRPELLVPLCWLALLCWLDPPLCADDRFAPPALCVDPDALPEPVPPLVPLALVLPYRLPLLLLPLARVPPLLLLPPLAPLLPLVLVPLVLVPLVLVPLVLVPLLALP
ncbi:hypothetical protein D7S86_06200 [Pararobbsia silviterrae]|uniref:Uncharacterized protein n=1 Tax=Pararobbsia silviterrae TaxID=1792498 RepID=A0A494Y4C7_9BURK|nr:hypothetical protein D7S86_06200 [Pararobbsia silviterrae]